MHIAKHQRIDGSYLLVLAGELDLSTGSAVEQAGLRLLGHDGCTRLVLDLMDVSFLDCAGLRALLGLHTTAHDADVPLTLLDPSQPVMRLLHLAGLEHAFDVELTAAQFGPPPAGR
jgi:anti-anti-sigma factor